MKRFTILFAVCAVCALCASCSTINNVHGLYEPRKKTFGGTAMNLEAITGTGRCKDLGPLRFGVCLLGILDLPFSFVADIITLPHTLWVDLTQEEADEDPPPEVDAIPPEERQDE